MTEAEPQGVPDVVRRIEEELRVPTGFFLSLVEESDWSFVIKIHALMESAFTHLISQTLTISVKDYSPETFNEQSLSQLLAWIELSGKRVGKIAFAESLGLIFDFQRSFISRLSELRNELVHKVTNVSFEFPKYVASLDKNQKANLIDAFGFAVGSTASIKALLKTDMSKEDFVLQKTKFAIWLCALVCLSEITYCIDAFYNKKVITEFQKKKAKMLDELMVALGPALEKVKTAT
jgi:hypothetical protein